MCKKSKIFKGINYKGMTIIRSNEGGYDVEEDGYILESGISSEKSAKRWIDNNSENSRNYQYA